MSIYTYISQLSRQYTIKYLLYLLAHSFLVVIFDWLTSHNLNSSVQVHAPFSVMHLRYTCACTLWRARDVQGMGKPCNMHPLTFLYGCHVTASTCIHFMGALGSLKYSQSTYCYFDQ